MNFAYITDDQIDTLAALYAKQVRDDLHQQRCLAQIEEDMTDAGKATVSEPESRLVKLNLSVEAGPALGKTSLLLFLLDKLADAGLMSSADTKAMTIAPISFLYNTRVADSAGIETLALVLDLAPLTQESESPETIMLSEEPEYLADVFTFDRFCLRAARSPIDMILETMRASLKEAFEMGFGYGTNEMRIKLKVI